MTITLEEANRLREGLPTLLEALSKRTDTLHLSVRSLNALRNAKLDYVWQVALGLRERHAPRLVKNLGVKSYIEIKELLYDIGVTLNPALAEELMAALKSASAETLPSIPFPTTEPDFAAMLEQLRVRLEARRADLRSERSQLVVIESVVRDGMVHVIALPSTPDTVAEAIAKHRETGSLDAFTERIAAIDRLLGTIERAFDRPYPFPILHAALKALVAP